MIVLITFVRLLLDTYQNPKPLIKCEASTLLSDSFPLDSCGALCTLFEIDFLFFVPPLSFFLFACLSSSDFRYPRLSAFNMCFTNSSSVNSSGNPKRFIASTNFLDSSRVAPGIPLDFKNTSNSSHVIVIFP